MATKLKKMYTEVRGRIEGGEVLTETEVSYNLFVYLDYGEPIRVIRAKKEVFTTKKEAKSYFNL